MDQTETIVVKTNTETICCDGGQDSVEHPAVYFTFDDNNKIVCNYCGKTYIKEKKPISKKKVKLNV